MLCCETPVDIVVIFERNFRNNSRIVAFSRFKLCFKCSVGLCAKVCFVYCGEGFF